MTELPFDIQAEKALIGSCLLGDFFGIATEENISPDDFYVPLHRIIWQQIVELNAERQPVDYVTITAKLLTKEKSDSGTYEYLSTLTNVVATPRNCRSYARIVHDKAQLRRIITRCVEVEERARKSEGASEIALDAAESLLLITQTTADFTQSRSIGTVIEQIDREYEGIQNGTTAPPIKTGFQKLDALIQLQGGNIFVIAGLSNSGKTALASGIAANVAIAGEHVLWISSEMSHTEMTARFIGLVTEEIPAREIRRKTWGYLAADPRIPPALKEFLHQVYLPGGTENELRRIVTQATLRIPIKLVVIDYIQRLTYSRSSGHEAQDMGKISGTLKRMAGELNVPFIVLSQLSNPTYDRATGKTREPELYDLKWSGDIVNDADGVMFVHRVGGQDGDSEYYYKWLLRKNKHDARGEIRAKFVTRWVKFFEWQWYDPEGKNNAT